MRLPKILISFFLLSLYGISLSANAEQAQLKHFASGSYQQLLKQYADKPIVVMIWSIHCTTCLEKMPLLSELRKNKPDINLIMIATDDVSATNQVRSILNENKLDQVDNWILLMRIHKSFAMRLIRNGMVKCPALIFSIKIISVSVLVVLYRVRQWKL